MSKTKRNRRGPCVPALSATALIVALLPVLLSASGPSAAWAAPKALAGVNVLGWGVHDPNALAVNGQDLFVASGDAVLVLDTVTGALVRTISGPAYGFVSPLMMHMDGADLFVTTVQGAGRGAITEVNATTGALVRIISAPRYQLSTPVGMTGNGPDLFVANSFGGAGGNGSVTEINVSTGALVRVITGPQYQFSAVSAVALAGPDLFVSNSFGGPNSEGSLIEINATTGALVRVLESSQYQLWARSP